MRFQLPIYTQIRMLYAHIYMDAYDVAKAL
jgi:hypothetical protein